MVSSISGNYALIDDIAEEFATRFRRGERPSLAEYMERYPELADDIREMLPALVQMEQVDQEIRQRTPSQEKTLPQLTEIGDYRILREIGRGGMGVVYEAEQLSLGRRVALKTLPISSLKDTKALVRFQREARAAARLHHTNIVPVFDVGQENEVCYYAMQLIQGNSLDEIIEELRHLRARTDRGLAGSPRTIPDAHTTDSGLRAAAASMITGEFQVKRLNSSSSHASPLDETHCYETAFEPPEGRQRSPNGLSSSSMLPGNVDLSRAGSQRDCYYRSVAQIGQQVADALAYAHTRGIIHRDIKPANLLLDSTGVVWVTDFGLAKTQDEGLTNTGDLVGTFRFMAPERFQGASDGRSDVYALGLSLYEMLTLKPAHAASDPIQLIEQIKQIEPVRPRQIDPGIPLDLETVILKAIDKEPNRRYPTPNAMANDLRRFLADEPVQARRTSTMERIWRWSRRNRIVAGLAASVLLLIGLLAMISTIGAFQLSKALEESQSNYSKLQVAMDEGNEKLWESYLAKARAVRMSRRIGQRYECEDAIHQAMKLPLPYGRSLDELRHEVISSLALPDFRLIRQFHYKAADAVSMAFDGGFERYAKIVDGGRISIRRVADDSEVMGFQGTTDRTDIALSRDGRWLTTWGREKQTLQCWQLNGVTPQRILDQQDVTVCGFCPESKRLAVIRASGHLDLFELDAGTWRQRIDKVIAANTAFFADLAFHPHEQKLAVAGPNGVAIVDLDSGQSSLAIPKELHACQVRWHPNGRALAVAVRAHSSSTDIRIWDMQSCRKMYSLPGLKNFGAKFFFACNGNALIGNDWSGKLYMWNPNTGQTLFSTNGQSLAVSTDDKCLAASIDGKSGIWEIANLWEFYQTIVKDPFHAKSTFYVPSVSPDGQLLTITMDEGIAVWDLITTNLLASVRLENSVNVFESSGTLITNLRHSGMFRWPVNRKGGSLQIGPPHQVDPRYTSSLFVHNQNAHRIAQVIDNGVVIWHEDEPRKKMHLQPHYHVGSIAISPHGEWIATSGKHAVGVKIWETTTGKLVKELLASQVVDGVAFSPDGSWLVTSAIDCRLWSTSTWEEKPGMKIGTMLPAFSSDGKLMANSISHGVIAVVEVESNRVVIKLEDPHGDSDTYMTFSPDGTRLISSNKTDSGAIHVWNLQAIRRHLQLMRLDWDAPPFPQTTPFPAESPHVQIDYGNIRELAEVAGLVRQAHHLFDEKKYKEGIAALDMAAQKSPTHALANNNLAWYLLIGPKELRDPRKALVHAQQGVASMPDDPIYLNTLGVAYFRNEQYHEAITTLRKCLAAGQGESDAFDLFFLSMCHHQLGDRVEAQKCYDQAITWVKTKTPTLPPFWVQELNEIKAEVDEWRKAQTSSPR